MRKSSIVNPLLLAIDAFRSGNAKDAIEILECAKSEFSDHAALLWYLAGMYQADGRLDCAIPLYRRASELAPKSERASLGLFHALWETNQRGEALAELKRFQLLTNHSCADYVEFVREINEE